MMYVPVCKKTVEQMLEILIFKFLANFLKDRLSLWNSFSGIPALSFGRRFFTLGELTS